MQPPTRPPGQASPRARSPRHDSDTDASPTRRVRARTTQAGSSLAGRLPARQGAAAPSVEAGPSSRQPRTAVPPPRAPAPTQPSGSAGASTSTGAGGAPQATPARTDAAPQAAESLRQELAALGIQGPPSRAQFVPLVMAAVARPDLEPRIHQAAAALLAHQEGTGHDVGEALRSLWLFLQLGSPAAARVIERILVPGGAPEAGRAPSSDSEATGSDEDDRGLEGDLAHLGAPLGSQFQAWLGDAARTSAVDLHAFDEEEASPAFARMLERLHQEALPELSATARREMEAQVKVAFAAMAQDAELRNEVFLIAQTALGSCQDNVLEGFSKVMLAVRKLQLVMAARRGLLNEAKLHQWTSQQFRLALLETAVGHLISEMLQRTDMPSWERDKLRRDPLETLAHAKSALRRALELPKDTVQHLTSVEMSVLGPEHLEALKARVQQQAADPQAYRAFILQHDTWRTCMQVLHPEIFQPLEAARDADPFHELDIPQDSESPAAYAYAEAGRQVYERWQASVQHALETLADHAWPVPPQPGPQAPGPSAGGGNA
ncbi:NEL-type E3 ubiquitin ligase domain-containing protein [Paracidovorax citrulli]|uniref:NEL-type E3 ubiquitin ligase domain-containing protein n=1 Tax=Paracidovorax citrulli TaxID=80869 RepID=UPI00088A53F3|nr:NEL-type E3 ubiquitin ligase domain-containing protein [Paracidovorax citrulli]QCX11063.1 Putative Type III effector, E3 ligase domain protein [Paracidovorax citrulli]UEG45967.1 hypothetical protein LKW27_20340 [Paracidovorax citrulli]WIY34423.1 NEL-type E3 ubiquitin ligase domain-containing protein [Paracidovorax citrulli]SDL09280.1 C-terminal novel E3 ligase, LRR-interacting [Paracidovorax citrulli]